MNTFPTYFKNEHRLANFDIIGATYGVCCGNMWFNFLQPPAPPLSGPRSPHYRGFTMTLRHTTSGRIPLYEWSARRTGLYLTTHNNHIRQTSMPPAGFEPTMPTSKRPQIHALDRAETWIVMRCDEVTRNFPFKQFHYFELCNKRFVRSCVSHGKIIRE